MTILNAKPANHEQLIRDMARADADTLGYLHEPRWLDAVEVWTDGHDPSDGPCPTIGAIEALGDARAAKIYRNEWEQIRKEHD